jgi:LmbE family N-acetylglucosaminyl deacetylase
MTTTPAGVALDKRSRSSPHCCALERLAGPSGALLVVAAHPDDETVGLGATLGRLYRRGWRIEVLHVTDGAPRDPTLRPTLATLESREAAMFRRAELQRALRITGLPVSALASALAVADQEATLVLATVARALAARFADRAPDVVLTHPYEGGHPDHDAVAFAVHAARDMLSRERVLLPLGEMSSYYADPAKEGVFVTGGFRAADPFGSVCVRIEPGRLDPEERRTRRAMLAAFSSQREVLGPFGDDAEPLRCAPAYDFTRAPHPGTLHYERMPFGWTGERFRGLARAALRELELP